MQKKRIYITGADGSLGTALREEIGNDPNTAEWIVHGVSIDDFDISDRTAVAASIGAFCPDLVLHLAAIAVVGPCETDVGRALQVNVAGVRHVAEAAKNFGSRLFYVSSDYVFDGVDAPQVGYRETDTPNPLSVYGLTKLAGEAIVQTVPDHLVIRTSWLFGGAAENNDDVLATICAAERGERQQLISDQFSRPTYTVDLARALIKLARMEDVRIGVLHVANEGWATRYELGQYALEQYSPSLAQKCPPHPIRFADCDFVGGRPKTSALNTDRLARLGIEMPHWQDAVNRHCRNFYLHNGLSST